ncbi:MAG: DUF1565 domain-containing protein, partial [Chitinophagaceae bacterium]
MKKLYSCVFVLLVLCSALPVCAKEFHVAKSGSDQGNGSKRLPFLTIGKAALVAGPGDVITVHRGVYRELVAPVIGG